jgi:hypothetical protein
MAKPIALFLELWEQNFHIKTSIHSW